MTVAVWLTLVACCIAGFCDVRARRIPNALTGTLAVAAAMLHAFGGWRSLALCLSVMAVLTIGGALIYARGGIGGGDVKLAIAASGMLSYPLCLPFLLYSAIGGGLLAIFYLLFRGEARAAFERVALMTVGAAPAAVPRRRETLPYALAFVLGAFALALAQSVAPFLKVAGT